MSVPDFVDHLFRRQAGQMVATLTRRLGSTSWRKVSAGNPMCSGGTRRLRRHARAAVDRAADRAEKGLGERAVEVVDARDDHRAGTAQR